MRTTTPWALALVALICSQAFVTSLFAQPPGRGGYGASAAVTLYEHENFGGRSQSFNSDVPNLKYTPFGNDRATSIVVAPGCRVELYRDKNFRGGSAVIEGNVPDLGRTPVGNDALTSLRVVCGYGGGGYDGGYGGGGYGSDYGNAPPGQKSGVTLYEGYNFSGRSETFHQDDPRLNNNIIGDNRVRSVSVAPGCTATLFDLYDYGGSSIYVDRDFNDLASARRGNLGVSSLRVQCTASGHGYGYGNPGQGNPGYGNPGYGNPGYGNPGYGNSGRRGVTVYKDEGFRGRSETFYGDVANFRRTRVGNDEVTAIRVDRGCRAILYSDSEFRGRVTVLEYDLGNLDGTEVGNDRLSSMQVDCRGRR